MNDSYSKLLLVYSVTILGDLLHFGQLFKDCGNNFLAQIAPILGNFCKGVKIFIFLVEFFLGNFYRHLATFYWYDVYSNI